MASWAASSASAAEARSPRQSRWTAAKSAAYQSPASSDRPSRTSSASAAGSTGGYGSHSTENGARRATARPSEHLRLSIFHRCGDSGSKIPTPRGAPSRPSKAKGLSHLLTLAVGAFPHNPCRAGLPYPGPSSNRQRFATAVGANHSPLGSRAKTLWARPSGSRRRPTKTRASAGWHSPEHNNDRNGHGGLGPRVHGSPPICRDPLSDPSAPNASSLMA